MGSETGPGSDLGPGLRPSADTGTLALSAGLAAEARLMQGNPGFVERVKGGVGKLGKLLRRGSGIIEPAAASPAAEIVPPVEMSPAPVAGTAGAETLVVSPPPAGGPSSEVPDETGISGATVAPADQAKTGTQVAPVVESSAGPAEGTEVVTSKQGLEPGAAGQQGIEPLDLSKPVEVRGTPEDLQTLAERVNAAIRAGGLSASPVEFIGTQQDMDALNELLKGAGIIPVGKPVRVPVWRKGYSFKVYLSPPKTKPDELPPAAELVPDVAGEGSKTGVAELKPGTPGWQIDGRIGAKIDDEVIRRLKVLGSNQGQIELYGIPDPESPEYKLIMEKVIAILRADGRDIIGIVSKITISPHFYEHLMTIPIPERPEAVTLATPGAAEPPGEPAEARAEAERVAREQLEAIDRQIGEVDAIDRISQRGFSELDVESMLNQVIKLESSGSVDPRAKEGLQSRVTTALDSSPYARRPVIRDEVLNQIVSAAEAGDNERVKLLITAVQDLGLEKADRIPGIDSDLLESMLQSLAQE